MAGADTTKPAKTQRRKLFDLHSWVGYHLAVLMSVVLLTGTLATISDELDWLTKPAMRITPQDDVLSWGALETGLRNVAGSDRLQFIQAGEGSRHAWRGRFADQDGRTYYLFVDPHTAQVQGRSSGLTIQRFLRDLHRYLFFPGVIGLPLVCSMAIVLAISLYTGLMTTRRWSTAAFRVRMDRGVRIAVGDWHKAAGLWGSWLIILMIVTSLWYVAEFAAEIAGDGFEPTRPTMEARISTQIASLDRHIAIVKVAFPELKPTQVLFPTRDGEALTIVGRAGDILLRDRANRVFLDPASAEIIQVQRAEEIGWLAWLNEMADPLHFGDFGGLTTKLIWFTFGIALTSLSLTGVWLTARRLRALRITRTQIATMPVLLASAIVFAFYVQRFA
ncbi:PepSY-associated TM helix domain-containing protein [Aestuariibius insulae]|uniref:PepSY-associated TM helix domain-containing protein n=1 Tax=Aestuariibius insulae TaxID=2058287 RepID=UPI00345EF593